MTIRHRVLSQLTQEVAPILTSDVTQRRTARNRVEKRIDTVKRQEAAERVRKLKDKIGVAMEKYASAIECTDEKQGERAGEAKEIAASKELIKQMGASKIFIEERAASKEQVEELDEQPFHLVVEQPFMVPESYNKSGRSARRHEQA